MNSQLVETILLSISLKHRHLEYEGVENDLREILSRYDALVNIDYDFYYRGHYSGIVDMVKANYEQQMHRCLEDNNHLEAIQHQQRVKLLQELKDEIMSISTAILRSA